MGVCVGWFDGLEVGEAVVGREEGEAVVGVCVGWSDGVEVGEAVVGVALGALVGLVVFDGGAATRTS